MRPTTCMIAGLAIAAAATPAAAEVTQVGPNGFASLNSAIVAASPEDAWIELTGPAAWWNSEHTYSGDAANMSLYPVAGGCFCEEIPASGAQIEHMRVIYVAPNETLRMSGGLGPLQAEAVIGTLSITLAPTDGGTKLTWDYAVGGFMRLKAEEIAPLVDMVLREQLTRLAARLGPAG